MSPTENDFDLRSCVVNLEQQITGIFLRLVVLEKFQVQSEISDACNDEQWKHMDNQCEQYAGKGRLAHYQRPDSGCDQL